MREKFAEMPLGGDTSESERVDLDKTENCRDAAVGTAGPSDEEPGESNSGGWDFRSGCFPAGSDRFFRPAIQVNLRPMRVGIP